MAFKINYTETHFKIRESASNTVKLPNEDGETLLNEDGSTLLNE